MGSGGPAAAPALLRYLRRAIEAGRARRATIALSDLLFMGGVFMPRNCRAELDVSSRGATIVRPILGIALLLVGVGTLSCRVAGPSASGPILTSSRQWVRTANGWERTDMWEIAAVSEPGLHPLVVAAAQGLVSV